VGGEGAIATSSKRRNLLGTACGAVRLRTAMRRVGVKHGGLAALLAALVSLAVAQSAGAVTDVTYNTPGAPIVSTAQTVFVPWGPLVDSTLDATDAAMLSDIAASAGATDNVFSMLAQYSTTNITGVLPAPGGTNQVLAQTQHYLGRFQIAPSIGDGTSTATITFAQIEAELNAQIAAGHLPAPAGPGPQTTYVMLFPARDTVDDGTGNKSGINFCGIHGDATAANGNKLLFIVMADNNNLWSSGCGSSPASANNETASLGHELTEVLTDPLVADNLIAWYGSTGSLNEQGEIGDMCATGSGDEGTNTFNGHVYTVQKVWDQLAAACVVSDSRYQPPSADFSATPSGAQASFAASASSPNADQGIASYDWSFGDGATGDGARPTHAYAAGGAYTVSLTVVDDLGFTAHATHQVTVSNPPPPPPPGTGSTGGTSSPPPPPTVKLAAQASSTALTSGSGLVVPLRSTVTCPAGATCTVTVTLTVPGTPTKRNRHPKPIVIGTATYRVKGGKLTPKVKLNARGIALLRRHHSLHATTSVRVSGAGTPLKRSGKLLIRSPAKKRKHR